MEKLRKIKALDLVIVLVLILIGITFRFLPHAPNFTPIAAIAIFGGVYLNKKMALFLSLIIMAISDIFIGYYEFGLMVFVYGSFLCCVLLGFWLKKHKKWYTIGGSAILSALLFFLITNFAVFVLTSWYPKTVYGLVQCYIMALPFFKNTLLGNLFFTSVFFGAFATANVLVKKALKIKVVQSIS